MRNHRILMVCIEADACDLSPVTSKTHKDSRSSCDVQFLPNVTWCKQPCITQNRHLSRKSWSLHKKRQFLQKVVKTYFWSLKKQNYRRKVTSSAAKAVLIKWAKESIVVIPALREVLKRVDLVELMNFIKSRCMTWKNGSRLEVWCSIPSFDGLSTNQISKEIQTSLFSLDKTMQSVSIPESHVRAT